MSEHLVCEITQKAIIPKDDKILLTKDIDDPLWELPGGRLNDGEKPDEGLEREILEEAGLRVKIKNPFVTDVTTNSKGKIRFMVVYLCDLVGDGDEIHLQEDEIEEHKWVGKDDWQALPLYSEFKPVLEKYFSEI